MHKVQKAIVVNLEDWEYLMSLRLNMSSEIREFLRQLRARKSGDVDGINIELERIKLDKNRDKLLKIQVEIQTSEDIIKRFDELEQTKEEEKLKKEKEVAEAKEKCVHCNNFIRDKRIEVQAGFLCKACYDIGDYFSKRKKK